MSDDRWTKKQLEAITVRGKDTLVSAAAGSGKTAVLVERIIRRITDDKEPIDVDRMLVVTFTKAAAAEMSQRIGISLTEKVSKIGEDIRNNPEDIELKKRNIHLQNQLTLLNRADIKTIHSFCLQVIREYYHIIDIDPAFKTADPSEISLIQQEIMEEYFEELYEKGDIGFLELLESYGEDTKDTRLKLMVLDLVSFANGFPKPLSALDTICDNYNFDGDFNFNKFKWIKIIKDTLVEKMEKALECMKEASSIVTDNTYGSAEKADIIREECNAIEEFYYCINSDIDYEKWYKMINKIEFTTLRGGKKDFKDERDEVKVSRDEAKKILNEIKEKYLSYSFETQQKIMVNLHKSIKELIRITKGFMERFSLVKKQRTLIDFNDYEHFALQILVDENSILENVIPTQYALEIQSRYDEIMIDEYQDSNLVQEMILSAVSNGKNRFIVGDVKQSIYSFRLAMPELFAGKLNNADENQNKILMTNNFRSRQNVLYGINFIFSQIMDIDFGDVNYEEDVALYSPENIDIIYPKPNDDIHIDFQNEVILIENGDSLDEDLQYTETNEKLEYSDMKEENIIEDLDKYELEISAIVTKINEMLNNKTQIYDSKLKGYRLLQYSDIAIITRSVKNIRGAVETIFTREGIPYYIEASLSYFDVLEVDTILNLLRIIDNPMQDIPLISVLRSPIYNITSEELVKIRMNWKKGDFYEAIVKYISEEDDCEDIEKSEQLNLFDLVDRKEIEHKKIDISESICKKINKFLDDIKAYREKSKNISLFELISYIYDYSGYFDYVGIGEGGKLRQGNLRLLLQKAYVYESGSYQGLFYFIRYIEDLKVSSSDESSAKDEDSIGKALHITTIHKSKGLEYPVVFVAMAGKSINLQDTRGNMVLHREKGIATKYADLETRGIYTPLTYPLVANAMKNDTYSEEVRILYVALTRAREKMIIVGCVKNIEKAIEKWGKIAETGNKRFLISDLRSTKTYLDLIMPSLMRHPKVKEFGGNVPVGFKGAGNTDVFKSGMAFWQECTWDISAFTKDEVIKPLKMEKEKLIEKELDFVNWDKKIIDENTLEDVELLFNWEYKYENSTKIQGKTTISEMKRKFLENDDNTLKDYYEEEPLEFLDDTAVNEDNKKIKATLAGTILHKVMELADFKRDYSEVEISDFIKNLVEKNIITDDEAKSIKLKDLFRFFKSDIYKRMGNADIIEKEHVFAMLLSPKEAFVIENDDENDYADDKILVNGMIDCYFIENNKVILLDYKSDKLNTEKDFIKRYEIQLKMYQQALEKALDRKVDEVVIYSFNMGKEIYLFK